MIKIFTIAIMALAIGIIGIGSNSFNILAQMGDDQMLEGTNGMNATNATAATTASTTASTGTTSGSDIGDDEDDKEDDKED